MGQCIFSSYYEANCKRNEQLRIGIKIALNLLLRQAKYKNTRPQKEPLLENDRELKFNITFLTPINIVPLKLFLMMETCFLVAKTYYYCKVHQNEIKYMKCMEVKCYKPSHEWGDEALLRLIGVQNDIVAADGRYHKDCKSKFYLRAKYDDKTLNSFNVNSYKVSYVDFKVTKKVSRNRKKI